MGWGWDNKHQLRVAQGSNKEENLPVSRSFQDVRHACGCEDDGDGESPDHTDNACRAFCLHIKVLIVPIGRGEGFIIAYYITQHVVN